MAHPLVEMVPLGMAVDPHFASLCNRRLTAKVLLLPCVVGTEGVTTTGLVPAGWFTVMVLLRSAAFTVTVPERDASVLAAMLIVIVAVPEPDLLLTLIQGTLDAPVHEVFVVILRVVLEMEEVTIFQLVQSVDKVKDDCFAE